MSAKDQMCKLLDQLMGQHRDGEFPSTIVLRQDFLTLEFRGVDFSCYVSLLLVADYSYSAFLSAH